MSADLLFVWVGAAVGVLEIVVRSYHAGTLVLSVPGFVSAFSNGISVATAGLLLQVSLTEDASATLPVGEYRVGLAIGGFTLLIHSVQQLRLAFGKPGNPPDEPG